MDVQHLGDRAEAVGGIVVPAMVDVVVDPPGLAVVPVIGKEVNISTFHVIDLAEQPLLGHVQGRHLEEIVAAVLQHHAVPTGALAGIDKLPAIVDRQSHRHLTGDMVPMLQRIQRNRHMRQPVRADIDQVDVIPVAQLLIGLVPEVVIGLRQPGLLQDFLTRVQLLLLQVAERHDLDPVDERIPPHRGNSPSPDAHERDPDRVDGIACQTQRAHLPRRPRRSLELDHPVLDHGRHRRRHLFVAGGQRQKAYQRSKYYLFH